MGARADDDNRKILGSFLSSYTEISRFKFKLFIQLLLWELITEKYRATKVTGYDPLI